MPEFVTLVSITWWKRINKDYGHFGMQLFLTVLLCHNFPVQFIVVWKTGWGICQQKSDFCEVWSVSLVLADYTKVNFCFNCVR